MKVSHRKYRIDETPAHPERERKSDPDERQPDRSVSAKFARCPDFYTRYFYAPIASAKVNRENSERERLTADYQ